MENNKINLPKSHILNGCLVGQRNILIKSFKDELRSIREADFHSCDEVFNLVDTLTFYSSNLRALNSLCSQIPDDVFCSSGHRWCDFDVPSELLNVDENAKYLGECALIPYDSPINNTNILFYNTLYDENASCHLAVGRGFTNVIKDYDKYTNKELEEMGVNSSSSHVDFMIGSKDLSIIGTDINGKEIVIFKDGNWAI